jgi:hypothetical protein
VSLLKRIEQGQAEENVPALTEENDQNGGEIQSSSRMSGLSARRVAPPSSGQRDTYHDLKTRVQNKLRTFWPMRESSSQDRNEGAFLNRSSLRFSA